MEEANIDSDPGTEKMSRDEMLEEQPAQRTSESKDVISRTWETLDALSPNHKVEVEEVLRKYRRSFSSTPGLCIDYAYEFEVEDNVPSTAKEHPILYIIREAVRQQIERMIDQVVVVVSQEKRISNSDRSTNEAEEMLPNTDGLERAESGRHGRHGCNDFPSISRSQESYGDFSEIPKTRMESEDIT
jgi:hypothetical protein